MTMQACGSGGLLFLGSRHAQSYSWGMMPSVGGRKSSATCLHMTAEPTEGVAMPSGIYQITNQVNGNRYIGSAVNLARRWAQHRSGLRHGQHDNQHLQRAFDKYGETVFVFSILERVVPENLIEYEQHYLDTLNPEYNMSPVAGSQLGYRHTDGARRKMREAHTGERNFNFGKPKSEETKQKLSEALMGHQVGRETRRKMSEAKKGERHPNYGKPMSVEQRREISKTLIGHPVTEETHRKLSEANLGKHLSEEHKRNMSIAQKARWHRVRMTRKQIKGRK